LVFGFLLAVNAGVSNFTYYFKGGLPFCSQCGTPGQYACSPDSNGVSLGEWNTGSIIFTDPIPIGNYPVSMIVEVHGAFSCNAVGQRLMFGVSLNGLTHGVRDSGKGVNGCKCDTCDGVETFTFSFINGVPGYYYLTSNTIKIIPYLDSICVNRVFVQITYDPLSTNFPLPERFLQIPIPPAYDRVGCPVCNANLNQWCSAYNNNSLTLSFQDPLPSGVYAISIGVYISANLMERGYLYASTLTSTLQSTTVNIVTLTETAWRERCGCMADYVFESGVYQRGWPAYSYGGVNKVNFSVRKYSESYGNVCIGRLGIKIVYYNLEDLEKYGEPVMKTAIIAPEEVQIEP